MLRSIVEGMAGFLVKRSRQSYRPQEIIAATIAGATLELLAVPVLLVLGGMAIDRQLGIGPLLPARFVAPVSGLAFAVGVPWLAWSILWQHRRGRGTPLPLVPTKQLLGDGPYRFTRNPMNFGAVFWLAGWAVVANSPTALVIGVGGFAALVLSYIKLVEERELAQRFGGAYTEYRRRTPFFFPRPR